jgi:hypothetical protein
MAEQLIRWVTPVCADPVHLEGLRTVLDTIGANPGGNQLLPLSRLPMLHFASLTLFDDDKNRPMLVFESNIDAPCRGYVGALVRIGRQGLDAIYSGCVGYPGPDAASDAVVRYLMGLKRKAYLYHVGHPNRSVQAIKGDYELRRSITRELETDRALTHLPAADIIKEIRCRAKCRRTLRPRRPWHRSWEEAKLDDPTPLDEIKWVPDSWSWVRLRFVLLFGLLAWLEGTAFVTATHYFSVPTRVSLGIGFVLTLGLIGKGAADAKILRGAGVASVLTALVWFTCNKVPLLANPTGWVVVVAGVILAPVLFLLVSSANIATTLPLTQPFLPLDPGLKARLGKLVEAEDRPEHSHYNHVAGLSVLAEGHRRLRWVRTWLALFVLNLFYRTMFVKGKLVTIPSIHFAQWSLVDDRHVLFLTNYDGGADSYLDDFFNSLAQGVAFIWIDTEIFPGTMDPRHLKTWVRRGQTLASVWYRNAVYEGLTVGAINSNTYIRKRLLRGWSEASARRWLRRFATIPEEPTLFTRLSFWLKARAGAGS